jgi:hypothetical protein
MQFVYLRGTRSKVAVRTAKTLRAFRQSSGYAPAFWIALALHRFSFGPDRSVSRSTSPAFCSAPERHTIVGIVADFM